MDAPHFAFTSPLHPLAKAMDDALSEFNSTEAPKWGGDIATQVPGVKIMLQVGGSMISMTMVLLKHIKTVRRINYFASTDFERGEERLVPSTSLCHAWRCGESASPTWREGWKRWWWFYGCNICNAFYTGGAGRYFGKISPGDCSHLIG